MPSVLGDSCFGRAWTTPAKWTSVALEKQPGVLDSKKAIEPVIGYALGEEAHFEEANLFAKNEAIPWTRNIAADTTLIFAAEIQGERNPM